MHGDRNHIHIPSQRDCNIGNYSLDLSGFKKKIHSHLQLHAILHYQLITVISTSLNCGRRLEETEDHLSMVNNND